MNFYLFFLSYTIFTFYSLMRFHIEEEGLNISLFGEVIYNICTCI